MLIDCESVQASPDQQSKRTEPMRPTLLPRCDRPAVLPQRPARPTIHRGDGPPSTGIELLNFTLAVGVRACRRQLSKIEKEARRITSPHVTDVQSNDGAVPKFVHQDGSGYILTPSTMRSRAPVPRYLQPPFPRSPGAACCGRELGNPWLWA